ncbi:MAG: glycosyltransferase [bacterium]|nr:glycosyltransferase [bacterium]
MGAEHLIMAWLEKTIRRDQLRVFHIGGYWRGPNDIVRLMMLGLRRTGVTVYEFNTDEHPEALVAEGRELDRGFGGPVWLRWEVLGPKIEAFAPHLIICNAGGLCFRPDDAVRLRRQVMLLGIALSDPDGYDLTSQFIAPHFDYYLTNAEACRERYEALGVTVGIVPPATNTEIFHPAPPRAEYRCEVLVLGRAHADRIEPVQALVENFDTHLYGEGWEAHGLASRGLIHGDELLRALNSAPIVPIFLHTIYGYRVVKVGLFDFPAAGALVMTNHYPEVEPFFRFDEEIVGFESTADLLAKVRYYLDHPERAAAIRRAGRGRVLRGHTWPRIWERILDRLPGGS